MESQPQNSEFRNISENIQPWYQTRPSGCIFLKKSADSERYALVPCGHALASLIISLGSSEPWLLVNTISTNIFVYWLISNVYFIKQPQQ